MKNTSILMTTLVVMVIALGFSSCNGNMAESDVQMDALKQRLGMHTDAQKFEKDQNYAISELQKLMVIDTTISDSLTQWFTSMMKEAILPQQNRVLTGSKEILAKSDSLLAQHGAGSLASEEFEREFGSLKAEHDRLTSDMETIHADMVKLLEEVKRKAAADRENQVQ